MATWRAEVFINSTVCKITTEVEAATITGAKEQIYAVIVLFSLLLVLDMQLLLRASETGFIPLAVVVNLMQ